MPKRSSITKNNDEFTEMADLTIDTDLTGEESVPKEPAPIKNQAAVELGRLGGLKGGKARALKLSAEQRRQIARNAALTRWNKQGG